MCLHDSLYMGIKTNDLIKPPHNVLCRDADKNDYIAGPILNQTPTPSGERPDVSSSNVSFMASPTPLPTN